MDGQKGFIGESLEWLSLYRHGEARMMFRIRHVRSDVYTMAEVTKIQDIMRLRNFLDAFIIEKFETLEERWKEELLKEARRAAEEREPAEVIKLHLVAGKEATDDKTS